MLPLFEGPEPRYRVMTPTEAPPAHDPAEARRANVSWRGVRLLGAGALMAATAMVLALFPGVVESVYASGPGPRIARGLSLLTGWLPFSVASILVVLLAVAVAVRSVRGIRRMRGGAPPRSVLLPGLDWTAGVVGSLLLLFYPLWGFNYARAPIDARLGLASDAPLDRAALVELTRTAAERTAESYRDLHDGSADVGEPTSGLADPLKTSRALEVGWRRVADDLGLSPVTTRRYGPVKTLGVTAFIEGMDIAGIYVPFTGEAHVSGAQPDLSLPAVAAHEQAHQRGVARENEATFAGLLATLHADDPLVRYSGWARVLRTLRGDLLRVDRGAWEEILPTLLPGVLRDWRHYEEYLRTSRSLAGPVATAANDAYLRAHGVPGGIRSYGRVTTLLLQWARRHDGLVSSSGGR